MIPIRKKRARVRARHSMESENADKTPIKRGRPMKRLRDLRMPKSAINAHLRVLYSAATHSDLSPASSLSPLERLPNEVIQQIFFNCFEINLARASSYVAQALSIESVYRALILFAFFDDDEEFPVATELFLPAEYVPLHVDERTRLQTGILGCRWCTLDRIRTCLPTLNRLAIIQAWHDEKNDEDLLEEFTMSTHGTHFDRIRTLAEMAEKIQEVAPLPVLDDELATNRHFFAKADYTSSAGILEFDFHLPRICTWSLYDRQIANDPNTDVTKYEYHRVSTLAVRTLPEWLVRGNPWTKEKLQFLQLLRQGSRFVHRNAELEVSTDSILHGMSSAIREQNTEALLTLLELYSSVIATRKSSPVTGIAAHEDSNSSNVTGEKSQPRNTLPLHLFHQAAKKQAKSSEIMTLLIRGSPKSIPLEDITLTAWALERKANGDKTAHWLLEYMAGTASYEPHTGNTAFPGSVSGAERARAQFPWDPRPFWEQLGYLAPCPFENR